MEESNYLNEDIDTVDELQGPYTGQEAVFPQSYQNQNQNRAVNSKFSQ